MSFERLEGEVASLVDREPAEPISHTVQLRQAHDPEYRHEVTERQKRSGQTGGPLCLPLRGRRNYWLTLALESGG